MLTLAQATALAQTQLDELGKASPQREYVLLTDRALERARGWAFPWNTRRFLETSNPLDGAVGNGPIYVDKNTGDVHVAPSGGWKAWLDEYDRTGIPPTPSSTQHWVGTGREHPLPRPRPPNPPG